MNKIAIFLIFLFVNFLATPTVVTYFNDCIDISMAYTANEEESSSKNQIVFEFIFQDSNPENSSLHFISEQAALSHFYKEGSASIFLDIISPPPKQA
jgi:hypothetical protein